MKKKNKLLLTRMGWKKQKVKNNIRKIVMIISMHKLNSNISRFSSDSFTLQKIEEAD